MIRVTLPLDFLDWWFAPWRYAVQAPSLAPFPVDTLGQRDAYRAWCAQVQAPADLPVDFDPAWHVAAVENGTMLTAAGRLFAGLLAARRHDQAVLGKLGFDERKWCIGVAATQPLQSRLVSPAIDEAAEVSGMAELAVRLQQGFPGLWHRLRLSLPTEMAARVDSLATAAPVQESAAAVSRAQRCWALCHSRVRSTWSGNQR